ncbi:MAG TPA: serine/threonine-protein kinase [Lacipirellulaceae bacterium]|nr:serine/threonine-protein kinase [Lacipirellulaceae bacterium]
MNAQAPQLDDSQRPHADTPPADSPQALRIAGMKFTYPSGSRPLDGYTIKRGVGRGGFGEVYFATSDAGKEVALKLIRRNLDVELRGVTQCLNLKHPNLIALYDIRTDDVGDQWVVMEYVSGESLEDMIERNPNGIPIEQALWWMRGICAGVAYLHDHGIVHRDLKPGNIFSDEGTVKIGDYGLAKFISCSRRSGQTESVGTVHYMAPEIANGRYGREIDTYALGIILFEMLTGHVPFEGESVGEVLMKHLTAEPDVTVLQEPYRDIVKRALAKDPNVRLKSVNELVALLPGSAGDPASAGTRPDPAPSNPPSDTTQAPIRDANQMARDGWQHAKRLIREADERVVRTIHPDDGPPEEPILQAIRSGMDYVRRRWHGDGMEPLPVAHKVALVFIAIFAVTSLYKVFLGLAIQFAIIYGIYYACWVAFIRPSILRHQTSARPPAPPGEPASAGGKPAHAAKETAAWPAHDPPDIAAQRANQAQRRRRSRTNWRERANAQLLAKPFRTKLTELVGSMLLAALVCWIAASAVPLLSNNQSSSELTAAYLWIAAVSTLGCWVILVPSKFVEGKIEDHTPMRITLMLSGAVIGLAAWAIAAALFIKMPLGHEPVNVDSGLLSQQMLGWAKPTGDTNPHIAVYVSYFAFLFLLPRWWRQTEYTRSTRMSLWFVVSCAFVAWLVHIFWWFPQPQGMIVAAIIALSTQLTSPWMTPSQRRLLTGPMEGGVV